jgi:hypothetical protein
MCYFVFSLWSLLLASLKFSNLLYGQEAICFTQIFFKETTADVSQAISLSSVKLFIGTVLRESYL